MNKLVLQTFILVMAITLVVSACSFLATPTSPTPVTEPPPPPQTESAVPATEAPSTVAPINLAGPEVGSKMEWVDGSLLVFVPGGEFIMGADEFNNPEHVVSVSDFWIYRTKVTNRFYSLCIATGICTPPVDEQAAKDLENSFLKDRPVVGVTWEQADTYCKWVQGHLPTEAQWEKTARGPDGNLYPWGEASPSCDLLNMASCLGKTSRVFDYPDGKSFYDALDMEGNTFEWTFDWYDKAYYPNGPKEDPVGPSGGKYRVVRSSSFKSGPDDTPPSKRFFLEPEKNRLDLGFRCVVDDPTFYPPYCETTVHTTRQPGDNTPPPSNCQLDLSQVGVDCGEGTADLSGGTISSIDAGSPLSCTQASDTRIYCTGPGASSGYVTVCGQCSTTTSTPPELNCDPGYLAAVTNCSYQGGQSNDGCPPGSVSTGSGCSYPGDASNCPPGTYYDTGAQSCVSRGRPGNDCLPGFSYLPDMQCCQATDQGSYPGCGPNEYYDVEFGCQPMPSSSGGLACATIYLNTGDCGQPGNSDGTCSPPPEGCDRKNGQVWDPGSCQCITRIN
jgi:formylglycine-generating enzyme required for sulfatase activity